MATPESFDAFYARTVQAVTSQMHSHAKNASEADHAIREAYARAYQQWYEVAGSPDPESWVLGVATDAYERRVAGLGDYVVPRQEVPSGTNLSTWPGIYRETRPASAAPNPAKDASQSSAARQVGEDHGGLGGLSIGGGQSPTGMPLPGEAAAANPQDWNQAGRPQQDWNPDDWPEAAGEPGSGTARPGFVPGEIGTAGTIAGTGADGNGAGAAGAATVNGPATSFDVFRAAATGDGAIGGGPSAPADSATGRAGIAPGGTGEFGPGSDGPGSGGPTAGGPTAGGPGAPGQAAGGTDAAGTIGAGYLSGTDSASAYTAGLYPGGIYPSTAGPAGAQSQDAYSAGAYNPGGYPAGAYHPGGYPAGDPGAYNQGAYNQGAYNQGAYNQGGYPASAYPSAAYPAGTYHAGAGADGLPLAGAAAGGAGPGATIGLAMPDNPASLDFPPSPAGVPGGATWRPRPAGGGRGLGLLRGRTGLVIALVAAVIIGGVVYLATNSGAKSNPGAGQKTGTHQVTGKSAPTMLSAGQTGSRADVPWGLVGPGWTLAEYTTAHADANGFPVGGSYLAYLVDPKGGKYLIRRLPAGATPSLVAWSGDAGLALFLSTSSGGPPTYSLLDVHTGRLTGLNVPADVFLTGFTQPKGLNLLAVHQTPQGYQLRRYNLDGTFQATLAKVRRQPDQPDDICQSTCAAISSPGGLTDVWGVAGGEMALVSNAGGVIRKLHVPDSGKPPSCLPVSWWDSATVLADCAAPGQPNPSSQRLWLVPAGGGAATPLSSAAGGSAGSGFIRGAWRSGGQVYVTQTTAQQCAGSPSGPGGLGIQRVASDGSSSQINVQGSTNNYNNIVSSLGNRLIVVSQTSCPGTSSLVSLDPATGASSPLLVAHSGEFGVVAATPYGAGPAAYTAS